jgi:hypothetical protein
VTDLASLAAGEGGHVILGAFIVWALAMVRRILLKTLAIDGRMDRLDERIDRVNERISELHPE